MFYFRLKKIVPVMLTMCALSTVSLADSNDNVFEINNTDNPNPFKTLQNTTPESATSMPTGFAEMPSTYSRDSYYIFGGYYYSYTFLDASQLTFENNVATPNIIFVQNKSFDTSSHNIKLGIGKDWGNVGVSVAYTQQVIENDKHSIARDNPEPDMPARAAILRTDQEGAEINFLYNYYVSDKIILSPLLSLSFQNVIYYAKLNDTEYKIKRFQFDPGFGVMTSYYIAPKVAITTGAKYSFGSQYKRTNGKLDLLVGLRFNL